MSTMSQPAPHQRAVCNPSRYGSLKLYNRSTAEIRSQLTLCVSKRDDLRRCTCVSPMRRASHIPGQGGYEIAVTLRLLDGESRLPPFHRRWDRPCLIAQGFVIGDARRVTPRDRRGSAPPRSSLRLTIFTCQGTRTDNQVVSTITSLPACAVVPTCEQVSTVYAAQPRTRCSNSDPCRNHRLSSETANR